MKLVGVKCPNCNAVVEVDEYSKSFVCKYCGVTTIIEKDKFNINYNDSRVEKAELFIRDQKDYKNAIRNYEMIISSDPSDPRPWLGLLRCATLDFSQKLYLDIPGYEPIWLVGLEHRIKRYYEQYSKLEKKAELLASITKTYNEYMNESRSEYKALLERLGKGNLGNSNIVTNEDGGKYNETIKAENKIISFEELSEVFEAMNYKLKKYLATYEVEKAYNEQLRYDEHEYTFNDSRSALTFDIDFYDNTRITINSYDEAVEVIRKRLSGIKKINVWLRLYYSIENRELNQDSKYMSQSIHMRIEEKHLEIDADLDSSDDKLSDVYLLIKNMVLNAPPKYDKVIKQRGIITAIIALGSGLIPSIVLVSLLFLVPQVRDLYLDFYVLYPALCLILGAALGKVVTSLILEKKYENIQPEKKYLGYEKETYKSIYGDDIDSYINSSEILIGHNSGNMRSRNSILEIYSKCKKFLLVEIMIIAIVILVLV